RSPIPTLVPYTTLFRSVVLLQAGDDGRRVEVAPVADPLAAGLHPRVGGQPLDEALDLLELAGVVQRAVQDVLVVGHAGLDVGGGDRKSTRLNSSHVKNS